VASFIDSLRGNDAAIEVIVGQGRLLTLKSDIATKDRSAVVAVGDPTILEFDVLPNPRMLRLIGLRAGVTDLSITTADNQAYSFEVRVVYDLDLLRAQLRQAFPDVSLQLGQVRDHVVVEGEARSSVQVAQILQTIEVYLRSVQAKREIKGETKGGLHGSENPQTTPASPGPAGDNPTSPTAAPEARGEMNSKVTYPEAQIINLLRVPGVHQVLLKVRIAELNRTATREIGADMLGVDPAGNIFGSAIGGATVNAAGGRAAGGLASAGSATSSTSTTVFGIFPGANFEVLIHALRKNSLLSILAEPDLVAMSGHKASFLAGGQFPVPVSQSSSGSTGSITVEWKDFGVQLNFIPYVLEDGVIRLVVTPEVSSIDEALGITLIQSGSPIPGLNTRRATTTVEMRQGETLAMAGLLHVEIDASTSRIPGLGDLPYIGPFFSNTSHKRVEKELLVLVTPYLITPMTPEQVPPLPNQDLKDPNDLEFFLLNRIEGRTGESMPSTATWDDPLGFVRLMKLERKCVAGPVGFSD
jgi:pilus assembly protein CpaC